MSSAQPGAHVRDVREGDLRVAVAANARRNRVASTPYRDLFDSVGAGTGLVACEINLPPANAESMAFHERFGLRRVGSQNTDGGKKTVCLIAKELARR